MPRKNKRKFFSGGKSNKNKTLKLSGEDAAAIPVDKSEKTQPNDGAEEESEFRLRKSAVHASASSVGNDSATVTELSAPEANATETGGTLSSSPRWCSEPNLTNVQRATIQLKVIQFVTPAKRTEEEQKQQRHEEESEFAHAAGAVPKLDVRCEEDEASEPRQQQTQRFDDNYRVESPKLISSSSAGVECDANRNRQKRHAMLIQEISESSSSEEVKQFLDSEACAAEKKIDSPKSYRVESPASSDECGKDPNVEVTVQEISESSVSEPPKVATLNLKIINIQELPSESKPATPSPKAKVKLFECKSEKKLNKAEEAIIEALYGNSSLLQIPNTPLDVISEEGSDYNSDIDTASKLHHRNRRSNENYDDDDEVFLKPAPRFRQRVQQKAEEPQLISAKLIETETNVPASCKKWETRQSDSELQAELVYLPSTSSSATDLSERSTDTEDALEDDEDISEGTETNSLLENISVPPLMLEVTTIPTPAEPEIEVNFHQLDDILEEEENNEERISESQQQIEDVNKELHHFIEEFAVERKSAEVEERRKSESESEKKPQKSETPTPTQFRRKYSSDSSTSSSNSQCTIIRQIKPAEGAVRALKDLCMRSLNDDDEEEGKVTVQKRCNSASRNAPTIPIIAELELPTADPRCREKDRVITILQVPPDTASTAGETEETRWYGLQSQQMPNVMVALSPSQREYMMSSHDSEREKSADVLLDMHKKFVERRAYHEASDDDDDGDASDNKNSGLVNILRDASQLEDSDRPINGCSASSVSELRIVEKADSCGSTLVNSDSRDSKRREEESDAINMNTIRALILRESSGGDNQTSDEFKVKTYELEGELTRLDRERKELEEELRNIQSLQHFKREEFLFNQRKLHKEEEEEDNETSSTANGGSSKYVNDDFNDFIHSNEKLHKEIYNEWQYKVLERNERKMQKILKITSPNEITRDDRAEQPPAVAFRRERAASERIIKLNDEFLARVKERQKRLSLPLDDNLDASTESLLNDDIADESSRKKKKKIFHFDSKENFPAHFREFIEYCEQEIEISKNSVESVQEERGMDGKNYVNSDSYVKLLRERVKRENKVTRVQNRLIAEQQQQKQLRPLCPKKPKKLSEKWLKQETYQRPEEKKAGSTVRPNSPDNNLLREIDSSLDGSARGFLLKKGIWSEQNRSQDSLEKKSDSPPPPPVWSPKSAPPSPTTDRKFRPVPFESPTLQRRKHPAVASPSPPPWSQPDYQDKPYQPSIIKSSSLSTISAPRIKQPNHIVFRKARADHFNEKPSLSPKERSVTFKTAPLKTSKSNELVYSIKQRDTSSEAKDSNNNTAIVKESTTTTRKMTTQEQQSPKKVDGVGPMSKEGIPLSLRSEVTDESREQWYKKMYNTIHKAKDDGIPYKSNGYASEPDANYDSDYVVRYSSGGSADRQRTMSASNQSEERYGSMEQPVKPNASQYKVQPGRIENYMPGKSSVSDKEAKQWWDDIMEIFDGWLDEHSSKPLCGVKLAKEVEKFHLEQQKLASNYTQGNLSRALKDQGYQSDSTLVFKKKNDVEQLSPVQQKVAYKSVQHGGEVPLHGFRKQAPEKPKDEAVEDADAANHDDVGMPQQRHRKVPREERAIINSEIICYPITNITRPLDMFGPFPKSVKSFVPVVPPQPPNRKSSRTNSTLKIVTHWNKAPRASSNVKFSASSSKKLAEINRSRSAGPSFISTYVSAARNADAVTKRICYRANSSSPLGRRLMHERKSSASPVAFGRGISKERAFAEEKKKVEEKLAKISKDLHVSTRILRNPQLRSPNEVKQAVQNTIRPMTFVKDPKLASFVVKKSLANQHAYHQQSKKSSEQKSLKVTVAISSRGREIMRASETVSRNLRQPSNVSTLSSKSSSLTAKAFDKSKLKVKSKNSALMSSSNSLARSNSTYSIDSSNSKRKAPNEMKSSAKKAPVTITSQQLKREKSEQQQQQQQKSFQAPPLDDNRKAVEGANEDALAPHEAVSPRKYGVQIIPPSSVQEKARMWNALASHKSEPSLRHASPVSRSKFHAFEKRNECYALFNRGGENLPPRGGFVMEQIYKYDSLYQLSDEDEFGNGNRGRSLDFSYSYHERSNSEPPSKTTLMTELVRPYSPLIIYGRNKSVETERRQRTSRSPSCRRIQSVKTNKMLELSSYQKEIVRAQSVGRTDRVKEKLFERSAAGEDSDLYRSKSLNVLNYERHMPVCGHHRKSERFRDLRDFYSCLERIGQLECATSNSELPPRRRNEEIIDYDLWQKVREYEKNERELNILVRKLRAEQRDKDFLFQPHTADEVRWRPDVDFGLITRDKSVENLREIFQQQQTDEEEEEPRKQQPSKSKKGKGKRGKGAFETTKDNYKPLWRASSVLDLATSMIQKYNKSKRNADASPKAEKNMGLSRKLLSTLSRDQLKKIKTQLTEIYSTPSEKSSGGNIESFVVTVPTVAGTSDGNTDKSFLTVRSHSELTKDQIQEPSVDISTLKSVFESKKTSATAAPPPPPMVPISETEKRSISQSLSQELKDKFSKKNPDVERAKRVESASKSSKAFPPPKRDISFSFHEAPPAASKYLAECLPAVKKQQTKTETESISSEASNRTVIFRDCGTSMDDVQHKIKYFEEIEKDKEKVETTIYHARDDSSPDEEEAKENVALIAVEEEEEKPIVATAAPASKMTHSQSFTDLKDLFGERSSFKSNTTLRSSNENVGESRSLLMKRSRSTSPESERCYKSLTEFGDVEKLKIKFENFCLTSADDDSSCQYIFSDSELNKASSVKQKTTRIRGHEYGNVSHITHKYEMQSKRARSRTRRTSPILKHSLRKDDRLMPHINVISKTASLKDRQRISVSNRESLDKIEPLPSATGEVVARIKHKFETLDSDLSLLGKMYTSVPDFRELNEISPHLSHLPHCGDFVSHQYPHPEDNNRSVNSPDRSVAGIKPPRKRSSSNSPIRREHATSVTKQLREIFSDDKSLARSRNRYLPDRQLAAEYLWQKKHVKSSSSSASVVFKDIDSFTYSPRTPPLVPPKNNYNLSGYFSDSQKRYVENDVNIHYKVPVRYEFKHAIPDDELARQQAEHMKKVYQEERRRKYLQELQDMSNRTVARALYSFQGQSARELSFKKGDIIYIRRQIDKNWYEGEHNATIGLLPVQYVDIISNDGVRPSIRKPTEGQARAKYNFIAQSDIELSLNKGELVSLTRRVDANWFEGRIGNRKGIFPVSYVDVLTDIGSEDLENNLVTTTTTTVTKSYVPSTPSPISFSPNSDIVRETKTIRKTEVLHVDTANELITYRAMYNYRPVNSDELELREGDLIYVLEQCDDGWFVGTNSRNGFFGTFPGNYVKRVY